MTTLAPYIRFDRNAREALALYEKCFNGKTIALMSLSTAPMPIPPGHENDVLHAEFRADAVQFYCTDCGHAPMTEGNRIMLALSLDDEAEQARIFDALAAGGTVTMPLADTFWNARFGMLTDRFGLNWSLNVQRGDPGTGVSSSR